MVKDFLEEYLIYPPNEFKYISSKKIDLRPVNKFKMKTYINKTQNNYQNYYQKETSKKNMNQILNEEYHLIWKYHTKRKPINIKYPKIVSIYGIIKYIN
jgi:hypothetical protein